MKKNKGFTLIELLAIIVILAVIAVITVPIILNIIENSKKGAATDSAYGYKDAVNKWYVSKLQDDSGYTLNGNYTVSNGKLNNIEIPLSGDKPTNGTLTYSNNVLTGGCLKIGDYKVTFDSKGSISETVKGECNVIPTIPSCPGCVFGYTNENWWYTGEEQTTLTSNQYKENYNDVISESGVNYFLGMILDEDSKIERAFACGILTKETEEIPFCIEGTIDGSTVQNNNEVLSSVYGNYNEETDTGCMLIVNSMSCKDSIRADAYHRHAAGVEDVNGGCYVFDSGFMVCY